MKISHLDHLVLTVADIPTTTKFYEKVLGMKAVSFGAGRIALEFGHQKINLHQLGNEFEPKAQNVRTGRALLRKRIIHVIFYFSSGKKPIKALSLGR
ncbi:biphenyl-2,3-diol 1,2-dioxygenase III-related protein [Vibrio cholerae]|nr:biphenyl-2,3-diol 1,2-dioxygenase III-related protein [Vibrio cholerae]